MKRIAILHYAGPPTIGGVESTIAHHADILAKIGYSVRIISGTPDADRGDTATRNIETYVSPLFSSTAPDVLRVKTRLDRGQITDTFHRLVGRIIKELEAALANCDVCIVHNVLTLHKNLPLTAALATVHAQGTFKLISWCHDLAWTNEQYLPDLHNGYPWNLLRTQWHKVVYVTVSEPRREELAELIGVPPESIHVILPGIDPAAFFHWTPTTTALVDRLHLLDADGLLLLPARITRRKNIALGLHVLAELRKHSGKDYRLIITGPPGPHNPANPGYLSELQNTSTALDLHSSVHFLYAYGENDLPLLPDDATMFNLYQLADAMFFPSTQEGFGIPMLEAGLAGLPIFCADIPALRTTGRDDAYYFDPANDSPSSIATGIAAFLDMNAASRLRVRIRQTYRWDVMVREHLIPLLEME